MNRYKQDEKKDNNSDEDSDRSERIKALIVRIGSERSQSSLKENLEKLSEALSKDLPEQTDFILDILFQCVVHLTSKTSIYGTLVGLIGLKNSDFADKAVERNVRDIKISIETKDFARIHILTRFAAELFNVNVISAKDLFIYLNTLMNTFASQKLPLKAADFFFYSVFSTLPHCGSKLLEKSPDDLAELLRKLDEYANKPERKDNSEKYYCAIRNISAGPQSFLDKYYNAVMSASGDEWVSEVVISPHKDFSDVFMQITPRSFVVDGLTTSLMIDCESPQFCPLLSIFDENDENMTDKKSIRSELNRCILFEYYSDIIMYFQDSRPMCIKQLLFLTEMNNSFFFLVECIFSLMLQFPCPQANLVYYGCVIVEFFKLQPIVFPKIVAKCLGIFFDRMDDIDIEARDRLCNWFGFHLNNFKFQWAWSNWAFVANLQPEASKRVFCENVIRQCGELSSNDADISFKAFKSLVPPNSGPVFAYKEIIDLNEKDEKNEGKNDINGEVMTDDNPIKTKSAAKLTKNQIAAKKIFSLLEQKKEGETVVQTLSEIEKELGDSVTLRLFIQCLLFAGAQSLSDLFRLFDKYKPAIMKMNLPDKAKRLIIQEVIIFWNRSHLHLKVILQKLVTYGFVPSKLLISELLSEENLAQFYKPFYSEIMNNILELFAQRLAALEKILNKNPTGSKEEIEKAKEDLMMKIKITMDDRKEMLRLIILRLSSAAQHFIKNIHDYSENLLYETILNRLVMFMRRHRELLIEIKDEISIEIKKTGEKSPVAEAYEAVIQFA